MLGKYILTTNYFIFFYTKVNGEQFDKILGLIESGKQAGANLACGGQRIGNEGYFIQPTVFTNVTDDMKIAKEEVCNPRCKKMFRVSNKDCGVKN